MAVGRTNVWNVGLFFFSWTWVRSSTQAWMTTYVCILRIPQTIWVWRATVEWYWQGKTEELREKPVPVPLCPPQIPHGLTRARTRASAVWGRRLTTWAMPRPRNVGVLDWDYTAQYPRRLPYSCMLPWEPDISDVRMHFHFNYVLTNTALSVDWRYTYVLLIMRSFYALHKNMWDFKFSRRRVWCSEAVRTSETSVDNLVVSRCNLEFHTNSTSL
jgi:hypothetical protein